MFSILLGVILLQICRTWSVGKILECIHDHGVGLVEATLNDRSFFVVANAKLDDWVGVDEKDRAKLFSDSLRFGKTPVFQYIYCIVFLT